MITIKHWNFCAGSLVGQVYDHPRHENGKCVYTSTIVSFDKTTREVLTKSGSRYILGPCYSVTSEPDELLAIEEWCDGDSTRP